jgi:hypothetical protein
MTATAARTTRTTGVTRAKRALNPSNPVAPVPRTSAGAVKRGTGLGREEWFALLDTWGAANRTHRDIAAWIMNEHGIDNWWAQTLTVDYEQARGLRVPGGGRDGTFKASASKTVAVPVERLFAAFMEVKLRRRWLPGVTMRERTSQPARLARFDWNDGATRLAVGFSAKGAAASQVALLHEHLPNLAAAKKAKAYWRERLTALKTLLER